MTRNLKFRFLKEEAFAQQRKRHLLSYLCIVHLVTRLFPNLQGIFYALTPHHVTTVDLFFFSFSFIKVIKPLMNPFFEELRTMLIGQSSNREIFEFILRQSDWKILLVISYSYFPSVICFLYGIDLVELGLLYQTS